MHERRARNPSWGLLAPPEAGSPTQVAAGLAIARHPLWTPDGKHLIVLGNPEPTVDPAASGWDWWVASLDGRQARRTGAFDVLRLHGLLTYLAVPGSWDPERGVLFAADLGDTRNIWQLRLSAGDWRASEAPRRLTSGTAIEDLPAAAAGRVAFSSFVENADIWSLRVDTRRGSVTGPLERLTENVGVDVQPALSGDGRRLAFTSNREGNYDVYAKDLMTGQETAITISPTFESRPAISADGSMVAYNEGPPTRRRVHVSSLRDPSGPVAMNVCEDCFVPWDWAPGNKFLLYWPQSRRSIGVLDMQSRQSAVILSQDKTMLLRASFSPDGRWIAFNADIAYDRSQTFIAPFRGMLAIERTSWIEVTQPDNSGYVSRWSPDGDALYSLSNYDGYYCLWRQSLDPLTKRPIGDKTAVHHLHGARRSVAYIAPGFVEISVARDRIVFPLAERTGNLWMAEWKR